jgi:molybdopterin-containing oxidoreductase family membrane subunit
MSTVARIERIHEPFLRPLTGMGPWYVLAVAALLALVGLGGYYLVFVQWSQGLEVTGLNASIYWGLYIINFVFLVGVSAGGIIVAALAHILEFREFKPISRIAELQAIACLILATLFIFVSLGAPDRFYHLFLYPRLESPLIWDVIIIGTYLGLAMLMGYLGTRADLVRCMAAFPGRRWLFRLLALGYTDISPAALARERQLLRGLSWVAIPAAVLLHSITAWILGLVKARATWHTSLLGPLFVVSAVASGVALVTLGVVLTRALWRIEIREEVVRGLAKVLAFSVPVLGYFLFAELLTVTFGGEAKVLEIFWQMVWGQFAPFFWVNLVVGLLLPLFLLVMPPKVSATWAFARAAAALAFAGVVVTIWPWGGGDLAMLLPAWLPELGGAVQPVWTLGALILLILVLTVVVPSTSIFVRVGTASALIVGGVFLERTNIVVLPQLYRFLVEFYGPGRYVPTWPEVAVTLGIYALGALAFIVLAKVFPLVELPDEGT